MINFFGDLGGSVGLGGGVKTDLGINVVEGARLGGVMSIRGSNWITDHLGQAADWMGEALDAVQEEIDAYMESKKSGGGIMGSVMGGVDFVGDDLLNLW